MSSSISTVTPSTGSLTPFTDSPLSPTPTTTSNDRVYGILRYCRSIDLWSLQISLLNRSSSSLRSISRCHSTQFTSLLLPFCSIVHWIGTFHIWGSIFPPEWSNLHPSFPVVISAFFISHTTSSTSFRWSQYSGDISTKGENHGTSIRGMLKDQMDKYWSLKGKAEKGNEETCKSTLTAMIIEAVMPIGASSSMMVVDWVKVSTYSIESLPFPFIPFPFTIHFSNSWEKESNCK